MNGLARELETAKRLAAEAGAIAMGYYGHVATELKAGDEPVTEADRAANRHLVAGIAAAFPGDGILAEESADHHSWRGRDRVWCIDPIDGTKEFIAQNGEFAVMVGLAEAGRAVLGVVLLPAQKILYWGGPGLGTFLSQDGGPARKLRVSDVSKPSELRVAISRSHRSARVDAMMRLIGTTHERTSGSVGIKLGLVARGEADLYLHPSRGTKLWDACGPDAILGGAGGVLSDCRGRAVRYDTGGVENLSGLVASNNQRHAEIIERIRPVVEEAGL